MSVDQTPEDMTGMEAARRVYTTAVASAESLWRQAQSGDKPNPQDARAIVDSLAGIIVENRTPLMALTALRKDDNYASTHMVNVAALTMAQARALSLDATVLSAFGLAALMHDIGKVNTPVEVLNKPGALTDGEFTIVKQHVVDGAQILRSTPDMPTLAAVVAFEHHLRQDLSGYPENVGHRELTLCTQIVSIADVFDALRSNRPYREGLATSRIRSIMDERGNPAFNQQLLRRFVNLIGLFPVGTIVRLNTEQIGVVTAEHPEDPCRPQVRILFDDASERAERNVLVNTWERDSRGEFVTAVVESVDPELVEIDPLTVL